MNTSFERSAAATDEWYTPKEIIDSLGRFDLDPCAPIFVRKLAEHGNGIALLFNRCDSKMFQDIIFEKATAMKFLRNRIRFYRPDGTRGDSPGCGSILIAFGEENAEVLRNKTPVARKEHRCKFCGEVIHVGEKYNRQSNVYDGRIYDCDEGLDGDGFVDSLNQYVYDNHYDDKIDDIAKDWQLPRYELVKKVLDELKKEE